MNGILYGVSVGPGDPELLTLKAVRVLHHCPVIATPQTGGENTLALDIAAKAADLSQKEILHLPFLMTRDHDKLRESHRTVANLIEEKLRQGKNVAMVNLGDVSVYSSYSYIQELVELDGFSCQMIPGVTSFCAVAAALGVSLTSMHKPIHIFPASSQDTAQALALPGTKVLMKTGKSMPQVRQAIETAGLSAKAMLVQNCGLENQQICQSIQDASDEISYFTTILVKD